MTGEITDMATKPAVAIFPVLGRSVLDAQLKGIQEEWAMLAAAHDLAFNRFDPPHVQYLSSAAMRRYAGLHGYKGADHGEWTVDEFVSQALFSATLGATVLTVPTTRLMRSKFPHCRNDGLRVGAYLGAAPDGHYPEHDVLLGEYFLAKRMLGEGPPGARPRGLDVLIGRVDTPEDSSFDRTRFRAFMSAVEASTVLPAHVRLSRAGEFLVRHRSKTGDSRGFLQGEATSNSSGRLI